MLWLPDQSIHEMGTTGLEPPSAVEASAETAPLTDVNRVNGDQARDVIVLEVELFNN